MRADVWAPFARSLACRIGDRDVPREAARFELVHEVGVRRALPARHDADAEWHRGEDQAAVSFEQALPGEEADEPVAILGEAAQGAKVEPHEGLERLTAIRRQKTRRRPSTTLSATTRGRLEPIPSLILKKERQPAKIPIHQKVPAARQILSQK